MDKLVDKFNDTKDFYVSKYKKYKDRKKSGKLKMSDLGSSKFLIEDVAGDYADILERSNKPLSRKWAKGIKDFQEVIKNLSSPTNKN